MGVRSAAAVVCGKLAGAASRRLGRGGGTAVPGLLALGVEPSLLTHLSAQLPQGTVLVTGTNGKTTTTRMLAAVLEAAGFSPLTNREGSNLKRGLATALLEHSTLRGRLPASENSIGLFEVDEAALPGVLAAITPRAVVVTNLFRDQLDRYGEVHHIAALWREALGRLPAEADVVLNADDPMVSGIASASCRVHHYGLSDTTLAREGKDHTADVHWCPLCDADLLYERTFYGHLGHYRCLGCGAERPQPRLAVSQATTEGLERSRIEFEEDGARWEVALPLGGSYNVYNAAAAAAAAVAMGVRREEIARGLSSVAAAFGRLETLEMDGRRVHLVLVKNPVGLNEVLRSLVATDEARHLLLILNDGIADGRDVSWVWDADLELLQGPLRTLSAAGSRAEDMALRLRYAGLGEALAEDTERDPFVALRQAIARIAPGERLYVLHTYTAMLELRRQLARTGLLEPYWEQG